MFSHDFLTWPTLLPFMAVSYLDNCYTIYVPFYFFFGYLMFVFLLMNGVTEKREIFLSMALSSR